MANVRKKNIESSFVSQNYFIYLFVCLKYVLMLQYCRKPRENKTCGKSISDELWQQLDLKVTTFASHYSDERPPICQQKQTKAEFSPSSFCLDAQTPTDDISAAEESSKRQVFC